METQYILVKVDSYTNADQLKWAIRNAVVRETHSGNIEVQNFRRLAFKRSAMEKLYREMEGI